MLNTLLYPFYNREEQRPRALWRLMLQLVGSVLLLLPGPAIVILLFGRFHGIPFEGIPFLQPTPVVEQTIAETPLMNMLVLTLSGVAATLSVWLASRFLDRRPFADLGLHLDRRWWQDLAGGMLIGAVLATVVFVVQWAMGWITITGFFQSSIDALPFALAFLIPFLFHSGIAIYEELAVRGYMLTNTAEGLNFRILGPGVALFLALVISALNFGLGHNNADLSTMNITLAGAWLALSYILTGELGLAIGMHLTWNLFQGNVFGFPVSGVVFDATTLIAVEQGGPKLWTGGSFGAEAGLLGTVAFSLGIVLVLAWIRYTRGRIALHTSIAEYKPAAEIEKRAAAQPQAREIVVL